MRDGSSREGNNDFFPLRLCHRFRRASRRSILLSSVRLSFNLTRKRDRMQSSRSSPRPSTINSRRFRSRFIARFRRRASGLAKAERLKVGIIEQYRRAGLLVRGHSEGGTRGPALALLSVARAARIIAASRDGVADSTANSFRKDQSNFSFALRIATAIYLTRWLNIHREC